MSTIDGHFHAQMSIGIQCANDEVLVENINFCRQLHVASMENTFFSDIDTNCHREDGFFVCDEADLLQVQDHIGYIFFDAVDSGKFMKHAVILIDVIATPSKDESNTRLKLFPRVMP